MELFDGIRLWSATLNPDWKRNRNKGDFEYGREE